MDNLITFPINNFDLSDIVLNHELPLKCLADTDIKMEIIKNLEKENEKGKAAENISLKNIDIKSEIIEENS